MFHRIRARVGALTLTFALLGALAIRAGDKPWETKPSSQWTLDDVQIVLSDSPWARTHGDFGGVRQFIMPETYSPLTFSGLMEHQDEPNYEDVPYSVLWLSSRTIREALLRLQDIKGYRVGPPHMQLTTAPMPEIVIAITGSDLEALDAIKPAEALRCATLDFQGGPKLNASMAKLFPGPKKKISQAWFYFPRQVKGEPVITPEAHRVAFLFFKRGHRPLKASFDPREMTRDGKPDF
jgi:hypothetical protein